MIGDDEVVEGRGEPPEMDFQWKEALSSHQKAEVRRSFVGINEP